MRVGSQLWLHYVVFRGSRKAEFAERAAFNRFGYVYIGLKHYGKAGLVRMNMPKHEQVEYETYAEEGVQKMLDACETLSERSLNLPTTLDSTKAKSQMPKSARSTSRRKQFGPG